ncbi:2-dehydropantoate 2-reductase [Clostridium homopropionicum DSM 5847]|uniref:2-dehydropantoate 2-reductase n=1 Tax=Clostridium homopropionicum DSM 5847 TaxID=1121318 RepID=A0A0L6ZAK7_9CLOT|nr:ketopantoate reductase family protein [Clostridium homopropionicum]KOA20005.1 2-dehydropantoate 2-reductase [Clostridium homopropionicum DSM 5847]SFG64508.1 2-dehydropantoate 2-reductase [Clostridium homopropionicum]
MQKIGFVGFGAIGGTYGAQMMDESIDIYVIVDDSRKERYEREGIFVNNKHYDLNMLTDKEDSIKMDIIFVSVKYHDLKDAIKLMKPFVGQETIIVSLLNGIDSEEILADIFGKEKVLFGFSVVIDALRIGNRIEYLNQGTIVFGDGFGKNPKAVAEVEELFKKAKISYKISNEMIREQWWKFLINVGINQTSAVLLGPYGLFQQNEEARSFMISAMKEVIELSKVMNINLEESGIDDFIVILNKLAPEKKTSMLQDVEAKRKTEVEMLAGKVIELGKRFGVPTPINELLFKMIKAIEYKNEHF